MRSQYSSSAAGPSPRACIVTLGCPKNETDSNDMAMRLVEGGYAITDDLQEADIALVNTCSFIQSATEESIAAILDVADVADATDRSIPIIVCGCMASRYGDDLEPEFSEVSAFVPCDREADILDIANECLGIEAFASAVPAQGEAIGSGLQVYVKISDGCSRNCAYCTIPMIRGPYRSFPAEDIRSKVSGMVERGVREIVLIGQDTGIWGLDLREGGRLPDLLEILAADFPETWFRVMYTQPESIDDRLLDTMASHPNICSYLDIPMQHCSERILSLMGRKGSKASLEALVAKIRSKVPGVAIRTTLMTGFPTETDEEFEELVGFVEESRFDYVGVFAFSPEEGTRAFRMEGQIDPEEREWRAERLRTVADAVSSQVISERIGKGAEVLVEGAEEDGQLWGRTALQAPEVDGVTYIDNGSTGEFVEAVISDTLMYDMEAEASQGDKALLFDDV